MGHSNKAPIIIDRQEVTMLIDLVVQISDISSGLFEQMALKIHPLERLLELEGAGGLAILYFHSIEVNL